MNEARLCSEEREELDRSFVVKAGGGGGDGEEEEDGGAVRHGGLARRGLAAERA